jgi:flagellar hook-associated protein 1 FlgK
MAAAAGAENQTATTNATTQGTVSAQAQALRDKLSGVSLDQEAVSLLQFQRGYQAVAKVLTTLNALADTTLALIPQP